jgi:uncharacterized LabA/DUF88 family protein
MSNRRLWLIDAGYLNSVQRTLGEEFKLDYLKLRNKIEEDGEIWRAFFLTSSDKDESGNQFYNWLKTGKPLGPAIIVKIYGYKEIYLTKAFCDDCNSMTEVLCKNKTGSAPHRVHKREQKGVDVGLATLALTMIDKYDTLVLSSGDADLLDAIEYILNVAHKKLELVVFRHGVSGDLQCRADKIHWINDFASEVSK